MKKRLVATAAAAVTLFVPLAVPSVAGAVTPNCELTIAKAKQDGYFGLDEFQYRDKELPRYLAANGVDTYSELPKEKQAEFERRFEFSLKIGRHCGVFVDRENASSQGGLSSGSSGLFGSS